MSQDHRERHKELHRALDELVACFITSSRPHKLLSNTTVMELIEWSHKATLDVDVCKSKPDVEDEAN